jgi:sulfur-oxidizing protein SoxY
MKRRDLLAGSLGALVLSSVPESARAQTNLVELIVFSVTNGAPVRQGRVRIELPLLADNGNSVPIKLSVDSPMTASDYVKSIYLLSDRNPVPRMATFHLGPRSGRAEISSRVRLAGSQRVTALAELSDGSFWSDSARVVVTLSACLDES